MTTATAEKPTCKYIINNGYTFTQFANITETYIYCPNCGKEIERVERENK